MTLEEATTIYEASKAAYLTALGARSETVGDTQIVHQDLDRLYAAMQRAESQVNSLSSGGIRILQARWQ